MLESHCSYPMLALFRSQHPGQSWITALGVVTDAAALACACIVGADVREPYFLYRRGRRKGLSGFRPQRCTDPAIVYTRRYRA